MKKLLITLLFLGFLIVPAFAVEEKTTAEKSQTVFDKDEIVSTKSIPVLAVDKKVKIPKEKGLYIYTKLFGHYTGTDLKGYEAVIVDNKVVQLSQGNTYIPENGYVVSGHGKAKKFIVENLFEGADVEIDFKKSILKVTTHPDNYLYEAKYRLDKIKKTYADADKTDLDTKNIEFYIERADDLLTKASKLVIFEDYENASRMSEDSKVYSDMALYFTLLYDENEFKGIKVFPYQKTEAEVKQAFNTINNLGIDNIFIDVYYNGQTIYKSDVQEKYNLPVKNRYYGEFDALSFWLALAKEHKKNIYATVNVFNLGNLPKSTIKDSIISVYPEWEYKTKDTELYLNPENEQVQRYIMAIIDEIHHKYKVAGINVTGLNVPMKNPTAPIKEFMNKVTAYQRANNANFLIDIYPFSTDIKTWNIDENITLCPVLTSSNADFTEKFLNEIKENSLGARILPVYTEPYLEEKPRNLFEQLSIARDNGIKGIILYNLDYLNREYVNALKYSVFNSPNEKKQDSANLVKMNFNDDKKETKDKKTKTTDKPEKKAK